MSDPYYYGPATDEIESLMDRALHTTREQRVRLEDAYGRTLGAGECRLLMMSRVYSCDRFHETVKARGLEAEFRALWEDTRKWLGSALWLIVVRDALGAVSLGQVVDGEPFKVCDRDTLMAPWRSVMEGCLRSRVYLSMTPTWPRPSDGLWPLVDAVMDDPKSPGPAQVARGSPEVDPGSQRVQEVQVSAAALP